MKFLAKTAKITAASNEKSWGGCFAENGLFVLLEVEGDQNDTAVNRGRGILELLLTNWTNQKERNLISLTSLLNKIKKSTTLLKTLTIGVLNEDVLYLGNIGFGEVLFNRKGKTGQILSSNQTVSGKVQAGDILLFTSKTFCRCLNQKKRWTLIKTDDWQKLTETGSFLLLQQSQTEGAAALVVTFANLSYPKESFVSAKVALRELIGKKFQQIREKAGSLVGKKRPLFLANKEEIRSKKNLLTVAVFLIILLIASIFFNINYKKESQKNKHLSEALELVSHQYEEAIALLDLNPVRARTLLSSSKLTLSPLLSEFSKSSKEYKQIKEWLDKIAEKEVDTYKIYKLTNAPLFFDITLIKNGGSGDNIAAYRQTIAILDTPNKVVYSLSSDSKQAAIIAGSDVVKEAKTIAIHGKTVYLLTNEGIVSIDISSKTAKLVIKSDEKWGEIVSIAAFAGNLYLLDRKNNAIWKYVATETGFAARASYLNPDVKVDFSKAKQLVIDGSVWVLDSSGKILKFTQGLGEPFAFKGLADTISSLGAIFTSDVEENFYVLENSASRILVFDKDGVYLSQYQWDGLKDASTFVVSEEEKKIFVLSGSKIYGIEIK